MKTLISTLVSLPWVYRHTSETTFISKLLHVSVHYISKVTIVIEWSVPRTGIEQCAV